MNRSFFAVVIGIGVFVGMALPQSSQPATDPRLEYRASQAFDRGDYATALPLLKKLVIELKDRPAKIPVITERIKVCETALAKTAAAPTPPPAAPRTPHPAPKPGQVLELTIKELGNFEYDSEKGGNIPEDVLHLSGCPIRLKGFMIPLDQADHVTQFALVPSLFSCCYGQPPQIQHTIVCNCTKGMSVAFSSDEVIVEGKLTVQETRDDGYITSIFQVETNNVKEAPAVPAPTAK